MTPDEIKTEFNRLCGPGWGTVQAAELSELQGLIAQHRPRHFLEIGTASGLSTGFLARFLEANGGVSLTSLDLDTQFFGDRRRKVGFQVPLIYSGGTVEVELRNPATALDAGGLNRRWQMAFIDGHHSHPWPILDLLAIWPWLDGPKIVACHDLRLFMKDSGREHIGIGPKYLFDQAPEALRTRHAALGGNTFSLTLDISREALEQIAVPALRMPWTIPVPLTERQIAQIRTLLREHYSPQLQQHFERCLATDNPDYSVLRHGVRLRQRVHGARLALSTSDAPLARAATALWRKLRGRG